MRLQKYKKKSITSNIYSSFALLFYQFMKVFKTQRALNQHLNFELRNSIVGFVPTMGALHEGHLSLIRQSKETCDLTVCSVFVNPTQFNNASDFTNYPKDHTSDIKLLESVGCDVLFLPDDPDEVYKNEKRVSVNIGNLANVLEGEHRPGHFEGVLRVVKLLFEIVEPAKAFFGLKDYQQYLVIQKMVDELRMDIEVVGCEIVREDNGLAMSSRNARLSESELSRALVLQKALKHCNEYFGIKDLGLLEKECFEILKKDSTPEYFGICDAESLNSITNNTDSKKVRAFVAASIGDVRLIDNIEILK